MGKPKVWLTALMVLAGGLVFVGVALLSQFREPVKIEVITNGLGENKDQTIWVDVAGAVMRPGVYELPHNARVKDALASAGGLSDVADREAISKSVNLAAALKDGAKLYFSDGTTVMVNGAQSSPNMVNINTSASTELEKLSGIGPARAAAIIEARPYAEVSELLSKKIIPESVYAEIKDKLTVF